MGHFAYQSFPFVISEIKEWDQMVSNFASNFKVFCCDLLLYKKNRRDSLCLPSLFLFLLLCGQQLKPWADQLKKYISVSKKYPAGPNAQWNHVFFFFFLGKTHIWLSVLWNTATFGIRLYYYNYWMSINHKE